jgi:hypothetical protein
MAKLKCLEKKLVNGVVVRTLFPQGYINVVDKMILVEEKFYEFLEADPDERPALLQAAAGKDTNGNDVIEHETFLGDSVIIDNNNCKVLAQKDVRKKGNKRSVVTVPLPDKRPTDVTYLSQYTTIIHAMVQAGNQDNANKFMFGLMLLTRCR